MCRHVKVFFLLVAASLCIDVHAGAIDNNGERYEKEIDAFLSGLTTFDDVNKPELTKKQSAPSDFEGRITFKLYTKKDPSNGQVLKVNDPLSFKKSYFDATKPTYFITHGWINSENSTACTLIRDAYLANTDSNVIVIDWSSYSMSLHYIDVTYKVKDIGETVSEMISWLYSNGLRGDDVTLIGHSLGAHVMGIAGYKLEPKVKHIVGLDPALHMFNFANDSETLSKQDAKHVQIIHTNAGGLGYMCPNGHADFFPNGGSFQDGCCDNVMTCAVCSHERAVELFAESITERFVATRCHSYFDFQANDCGPQPVTALMGGLDLDSVKPGTYYLRTGCKKPFSKVIDASSVNSPPAWSSLITNAVCNM